MFECLDVEKFYEKDQKLKREDVALLKEWLLKQPHLPQLKDIQVAGFLHSCYYSIEKAKITIDKYFTRRTLYPDIFYAVPKESLRKVMSVAFINILPKLTDKGFAILMIKLLDYKVDHFNFSDSAALVNMAATLYWHQKGLEKGAVVIFDAKGATFGHLTRFNITGLKHCLDHVQEGAPVRIKEIHFINVTSLLDKIKVLVRPLVHANIFNLFQFHASMESLYTHVPQELLPADYDGKLPSLEVLNENALDNALKNYEFFEWHYSQKVDESKRLGKSEGGMFGVEGTFKKLQLD